MKLGLSPLSQAGLGRRTAAIDDGSPTALQLVTHATYGAFINVHAYDWEVLTRGSLNLVTGTPRNPADGLPPIEVSVQATDIGRVYQPFFTDRLIVVPAAIDTTKIVQQIRKFDPDHNIDPAHLRLAHAIQPDGTSLATVTAHEGSFFTYGSFTVRYLISPSQITYYNGRFTRGFVNAVNYEHAVVLEGQSEALVASDTTGNRLTYSDGTVLDIAGDDMVVFTRGALDNYVSVIALPSIATSNTVDGETSNLVFEIAELSVGQLFIAADTTSPGIEVAKSQTGELSVHGYVAMRLSAPPGTIARVRFRTYKE